MKFLYFLNFCAMCFLLSCGTAPQPEQDKREPLGETKTLSKTERKIDNRRIDSERDRDDEIARLKRKPRRLIEVELESRYDGGYDYGDYGGVECEGDAECEYICDSTFSSASRKKCYRAPRALVENIQDGLFELVSIDQVDSVNITAGLIKGIMDIDSDLIKDIVEERMSEGDLKSFLAWVAVRDDIGNVFFEEDRNANILKEAFEQLGELQYDSRNEIQTGLNVDLIQGGDTFFYLAARHENQSAFELGYKVLKSACRDTNCRKDVLCAREVQSTRRSSRRISQSDSSCNTSARQGRRSRTENTCYVHGATTWSFLDYMIEEREISDSAFEDENELTVEVCNEHCDSTEGNCELIK